MKQNYTNRIFALLLVSLFTAVSYAQQLPNADFEDWSGAAFDGKIQPASWNVSNVTQIGFKFNFAYKETGRSGSCLMVKTQEIGAAGITEAAPGYVALGKPWVYIESLTKVSEATAGTTGGINFTYRPDTMQVWIRRTGSNTQNEDFNLLYYAWTGTAKANSYKGKNNKCTSVSKEDEESDIRQALDGNECGTMQNAVQIAEGWVRDRKEYNEWTCINVPIYYMNNDVPEKCNVIFSASNYPNFRANSGLYNGNALYIDDVRLIYSSKIQHLYIGNKEWKGFDPDNTGEQVYSVGNATQIPDIYATRGEGSLTNSRNTKVNFIGRRLSDTELTVQKGQIDGEPTILTVRAEDGSSSTTYKIRFISKPSDNARLAGIQVNGTAINGFNAYVNAYDIALPYGTSQVPVVTFTKAEEGQTVTLTAPTSVNGTSTIKVVAPDGVTTFTYTLRFSVAALADNTLQNILVNGTPVNGFQPSQTIYKVELPLGTTAMPEVKAVSAYPEGAQNIKYTAPSQIDGGQYQIAVTTPGNTTAKVYKLNFKITASTNSYLKDLQVEGGYITNFDEQLLTYYVELPLGTVSLPEITWVPGDNYQTVTKEEGGIDGTTRITVTAAAGNQTVYKIVFSTLKSEISHLNNIYLDGVALAGFASDKTTYDVQLPVGTASLPVITYDQGDEYQTVSVRESGLDGTTRITVVAGNGSTTVYQINFSVLKATNAALKMIYIDGQPLEGFAPEQLEYTVSLPQGTTAVPSVTWEQSDEWQTVTSRPATSLTSDYKITVRPQEGASQTYVIRFSVATSSNTNLNMIYLDGVPLPGFDPSVTAYTYTLPEGVSTIPTVTYDKAEASQQVLSIFEDEQQLLRVTAESGDSKTYTVQFVIQKSENAFLNMIYLDGKPLQGFESERLSGYSVTVEGNSCPQITVDKSAGQQVSIIAPAVEGEAQIRVTPEQGAPNTYVIQFVRKRQAQVLLENIFVDGKAIPDFDANTTDYRLTYSGLLPEVSYKQTNAEQSVTVLQDKDTVRLLVNYGDETNIYTLYFSKQRSSNTALSKIWLDGQSLEEYDYEQTASETSLFAAAPSVTTYTVHLPSGSRLPQVTYQKAEPLQTVLQGQVNEKTVQLILTAEDGTQHIYHLVFDIASYADATLQNIMLDGKALDGFDPHIFHYEITIEKGKALPELSFVKQQGTATIAATTSPLSQQIIVIAENGESNTYLLEYKEISSSNALLSDILLNGKRLSGFRSDKFDYVDSLAWRTAVVPVVQPVSAIAGQTITIDYKPVNETTQIRVMAEDGVTESVYTILFPVHQSGNTHLESVVFSDLDFEFKEDITDYEIVLPYQVDTVPALTYEKQEKEQTVKLVSAPVSDTTKLTVTAENGDTLTYRFAFKKTLSDKENRLQKILVNGAEVDLKALNETDETHFELTAQMPYGTAAFSVACLKNYDEQTYIIEQGGLYRPTVITLHANRGEEPDVVYTVIPQVAEQCPAVLKGITVNGNAVEGFSPERYSYIVNCESALVFPEVAATAEQGVEINRTVNDQWHWQATVRKDGYENTYDIWYHYPNEVIPNQDFTEWGTAKHNNGAKPLGWNVPADFFDKLTVLFVDAKTGSEVVRTSETVVGLETTYWSSTGGALPAIVTLGELSGGLSVANKTHYDFNGSIKFHNTPDEVVFNYNYSSKAGNGALFAYRFFDNTGQEHAFDVTQGNATGGYITQTKEFDLGGKQIVGMNIAIDATNEASGATKGAKLYVDWLRFGYNSRLSGLTIDEEPATLDGTAFTYTFPDAEHKGIPAVAFTGEVVDQAREIVWGEEMQQTANAVRTAQIRNFAEDGSYTDYTLQVVRPLSTVNTLRTIEINGTPLAGFDKATLDYTYALPAGTTVLPDITALPATDLQTVTITQENNVVSIAVIPEYGEAQTYTVTFEETVSSDATLRSLAATGLTYDPEQTDYVIAANEMPYISFLKQSDYQTVIVENGVVTVIAQDGTEQQYTIRLEPVKEATSGQLTAITVDDIDIAGFAKDTYRYEQAVSGLTGFTREYPTDTVQQIITPDSLVWHVSGTEQHTYTIVYPTSLSSNSNLAGLLIDGVAYDEFLPMQSEYVIASDEIMDIEAVAENAGQTISLEYANGSCRIAVVAADGTERETPYIITFRPERSSVATLQAITLDGTALADFTPEQLAYTVVLPTTDPKTEEPQMPSIGYQLGQEAQTVQAEPAQLGGTTYITVTSEDGTAQLQYELTIQSEPSHNALLNGIALNGQPLKRFEANRFYYSAQVSGAERNFIYSATDKFQTVTAEKTESNEYTLHVVAQDGETQNDYVIEVWEEQLSNNAFLQDIRLNNMPFSDFDSNADDFIPKQLRYSIAMPQNAALLPDIYVSLADDGQTWTLLQGTDVDTIRVTAPDGITTNDYILNFVREKSSNADLQMIFINGIALPDYDSNVMTYDIDLPLGMESLPNVDVQKAEQAQTYTVTWKGNTVLYVVTAEDGTMKTYELNFRFLQSDADTLLMIYEDGIELQHYAPNRFYYSTLMPVGVRQLPTLTYDAADRWQTITADTVVSNNFTTYQFTVVSQSGRKNVYTLVYELQYSAVDTLQMILVDGHELAGFAAQQTDYFYQLPTGTDELPKIDYIAGDRYQQIEVVTDGVEGITQIRVLAENGHTKIYNIHFSVALSDNAHLKMLTVGGKDIPNFDGEVLDYNISLPYGTKEVPFITYERNEEWQHVNLDIKDWTAHITVTAPDRKTTATYTLNFTVERSANAYLQGITLDGKPMEQFQEMVSEYEITLPFGTTVLPETGYISGDEQQEVTTETTGNRVTITVVSGNGEESSEYVITFIVELSPINTLSDLAVNGETIEGFASDIQEYTVTYEPGSTAADFFGADAVSYTLTDESATALVQQQDEATIMVMVTAANGATNAYVIRQVIALNNNALLSDLLIDGVTIPDFDPAVLEYEYILYEGASMPHIDAVAQDSTAEVSITYGQIGEITYIYCTALDGTEEVYTVKVHYTDINTALTPDENSVVIKHIPGTNQFLAATIRQNVQVALFDAQGRRIMLKDVPLCDPNISDIATDATGTDVLNNISLSSPGAIITLDHLAQTYYYVFLQNGKKRIASGKLMMVR